MQWTIYSATSFLQKCRKVVLEKCSAKKDFIFWSTIFLQPEQMYPHTVWYKTTFFSGQPFFSNHISWTRFLKPLFYTFLEKWLQNKWSNEILLFFDSTTFSRLGHKLRKKMFVFLRNWRQEQILQRFIDL